MTREGCQTKGKWFFPDSPAPGVGGRGQRLSHSGHTQLEFILSSRCLFVQDHSALTKLLKEPGIFSTQVTGQGTGVSKVLLLFMKASCWLLDYKEKRKEKKREKEKERKEVPHRGNGSATLQIPYMYTKVDQIGKCKIGNENQICHYERKNLQIWKKEGWPKTYGDQLELEVSA